jgi:hypothetical protein
LHVHIEETFLATNQVDYLGYTLSSKGIKPQNQKIVAVLALTEPKNKRQLRSFLGFVNFYQQLWYHQSHIISPLTAITSEKAKWTWGPNQQEAFKEIRNTIARQVLRKYPDFSKPFDILLTLQIFNWERSLYKITGLLHLFKKAEFCSDQLYNNGKRTSLNC